jgi:SHS2 domain-containing protein
MGTVRHLDDVALADAALEIDAADLPDLFLTAAAALAELTVDPATLVPAGEARVVLAADALDLLLFDFLAELMFRRDAEGVVLHAGTAAVAGDGPYRLDATLVAGRIDPERTVRRHDPKAPTFHRLAVERAGGGWRARVVLDI